MIIITDPTSTLLDFHQFKEPQYLRSLRLLRNFKPINYSRHSTVSPLCKHHPIPTQILFYGGYSIPCQALPEADCGIYLCLTAACYRGSRRRGKNQQSMYWMSLIKSDHLMAFESTVIQWPKAIKPLKALWVVHVVHYTSHVVSSSCGNQVGFPYSASSTLPHLSDGIWVHHHCS